MENQGQEVLSLRDALRCSTHLSIRWHHCKILRPTCDFLQMHLKEPEFLLVHEWRVSEETRLVILRLLRELSTRRSTSKRCTGKDYLLHYLRSPAKSTFKRLCKQTPFWCVVMSKMPQEPQRLRWPREMDIEQSAPTHAYHTHCAFWQLGTTADQRYDVPRDWLWDVCQMARVRRGTRCKRFRSEEGLHNQIDQSARNQLEHDQVQRAPEKLSKSCRQTSNNQPLFTSLEIPWGFLSQAVLRWLSGGLWHARKCQFEDLCEKKRYDSWSPDGHLHEKPSAKGGTGKECWYKFLYQVPMSIFFWENASCVPEIWRRMYDVVLREPKVWENGMRILIPVQPRKVQRNYLVAIMWKY
jgi:hypothetical protein